MSAGRSAAVAAGAAWFDAGGLLTAVVTRSGRPITMEPADVRQLLVSSLSATTPVLSAHARRRYVPARAVDGTVSATDPADCAPTASVETRRLPVSRMSDAPRVPLVDR